MGSTIRRQSTPPPFTKGGPGGFARGPTLAASLPTQPGATGSGRTDALKVVIIWPWLGLGGAERWLIALANYLPLVSTELSGFGQRPIIVSAVCVQYDTDPETKAELSRFAPVIVERQIVQSNPQIDAVVAAADVVLIGGVPDIRRLMEHARCPVVFVAHGACTFTTRLAAEAFASGKATHYTSVSEVSRSVFPAEIQPLVTVIENGAEIERTSPIRGREWQRAQWGVRPDQIVIGYVGRFGPDKRSEAAAEAVAYLPPEYVAVMVGNGDTETAALARAQALAPGRVIYGGRCRHVGDVLSAIDIWINCSPAEGFCLSRIEASLAGVPVVSTPTGDLQRLEYEFGELVWTVPVGASGEQIAGEIQFCMTCLDWPRQKTTRVARSQAVSFQRYTATAMVGRWVTYLHSIIRNDN